MAPWAGFEPATGRLTVVSSTTELPGNVICFQIECKNTDIFKAVNFIYAI